FPNVKLPSPFTKYQSLYNALVGTHFYIEEGAIDRNLTINFAITIPGGDTLYKKIGGKQIWFYGVVDVVGHPMGYTFLNNKAAVMKVPRHAGFNFLTKTLGWTVGTNYKFGYFNTQTNTWSGIGITSYNRDYPDPRIDTVEARISHFSDIGAGDEELTNMNISEAEIPLVFALQQNFPNPFNPTTNIKFDLPQKCIVSICVYNLLGEKISELINGEKEAGYHQVKFDAQGLSSGVYFYQMRAKDFVQTKKIVVLK
ncbi:MAG: T9SS type A sorting domain-containing protein, partial [Ignavibacteria bacterium]|nr:T9SS type A sorting domain-containing protein [Ignavibacteria bacterium]